MIKLGYACICKSLNKEGSFRKITVSSASKLDSQELQRKLKSIAIDNLYNTYKILNWNIKNNIYMYRMTSEMIPLATHDINTWQWQNDIDVLNLCNKIKEFITLNNIRVSMHPDQFIVLNSINDNVVLSSIKGLEYHNALANLLGINTLIIHTGGVSGNKELAIQRFKDNFKLLSKDIQDKIKLENDDKSFNAEDVLNICEELKIPMILDIHHNRCLSSSNSIEFYIDRIFDTWKHTSQKPKVHLSSGKTNNTDRSHSDNITQEDYINAINLLQNKADIMLECKEKELGLFRLTN